MAMLKRCRCGSVIDISEVRCAACQKKYIEAKRQTNKDRGSSHSRGYGYKWRKYREDFLKKNPLCVICLKEGKYKPSTVVDHITPHKGDMKLFWDKNNHQALCKKHHDIKTAKEDGGFGNRGRGE